MAGFFGKLPTLGDFISRGLPDETVAAVSRLLDRAFSAAVRRMDGQWYDRCQSEPALAFAVSEGVLGAGRWIGLLRPSIDRYGRSYPLLVMAPLPAVLPVGLAPHQLDVWLESMQVAMLAAIDGSVDPDHLQAVLDNHPPVLSGAAEVEACPPHLVAGEEKRALRLSLGADTNRESALAWAMEARVGTATTLWWWPDAPGRPDALMFDRLPAPEEMAALLDGDWSAWLAVLAESQANPDGPTSQEGAS